MQTCSSRALDGKTRIMPFRRRFSAQILLGLFLLLCAGKGAPAAQSNPLTFEVKTAPSGQKYSFIFTNGAAFGFEVKRPAQSNNQILLSIPAAFTTKSGGIGGVYVREGAVQNINGTDAQLGGALKFVDGKLSIFPTNKGKLLTQEFLDGIAQKKGILFQQFQVIESGAAARFKDKSKFIRRGIAILNDGNSAIIESKNAISLNQFGEDLSGMGVKELLYTDMGAWSEGWVRNPKDSKIIQLGEDCQMTSKQTNWLTLQEVEKRSAAACCD